jgi:glutaredoxin
MAKKELDKLSLSYHTIELDVSNNCPKEDCHSLAKTLMLQTRMRTVPQIFIKGRLIGGFTDLDKLIKEDKLKI